MKHRWYTGLALVACSMIPHVSGAQYLADGTPMFARGQESKTGTGTVLETPVTIDLTNVTLQTALLELSKRSAVRITFSRSVLPLDKRVSVRAANVPLGHALRQVLSGTQGAAQLSPAGQVVIVRTEAVPAATGRIVGKVVHAKTRQPVVGASVSLGDAVRGVTVGEDGTFRMDAAAGEHTLHIRAVGFVRVQKRVQVTNEGTVTIEIALDPNASVLDEVIVTGTVVATERRAIPNPITVITAEDLERRGITRIDQLFRGEVPGVLALERGTSLYSGSQAGAMATTNVYVRGSSTLGTQPLATGGGGNPLKTYVDGVELLDPLYLGTLDPASIERIEIIAGPQAATIYGSGAMGGVMQVFTKKGSGRTTPDLTLTVKYGILENSFSDGRTPSHHDILNMTGGTANFSYSGTLSHTYTGQWQPALFNRSYGTSLGATMTQGPVVVNGSLSLTSGTNGTARSTNIPFAEIVESVAKRNGEWMVQPTQYLTQRRSTSKNQTLALNVDYRPLAFWQHHLTVGSVRTDLALDPAQPSFLSAYDTLLWTNTVNGSRTTASYNMTLTPRVGIVSSTIALGIDHSQGTQLRSDGYLAAKSATTYTNPYLTRTIDDKRSGGFGSWQLGFLDRVYLTMGVRGEQNPNYGREHKIDWTPRVGITYTVEYGDVTAKLLVSAGKATRAPTADQRRRLSMTNTAYTPSQYVYQVEAPDLKPEYSSGPEGGVELYLGNRLSLTVNRYDQAVDNLIQGVPVDSFWVESIYGYSFYYQQNQNRNVAKIRQQGWEGTGSVSLGPLALKGVYSWNDSRVVVAYGGYPANGETFRYVPTHTGSMTASYAAGGTNISLVVNYVGASVQDAYRTFESYATSFSRMPMYLERLGSFGSYFTRPGYVKSDLAFSHRLAPWATASVNVVNLADSYASDATNITPSLGRQTLFGITLRSPRR